MGTPSIDLFATRANSQLPVFCSPYPDPLAWTCDALSVSWEGMCLRVEDLIDCSIYLEAFEENSDLDVMTDLCSETMTVSLPQEKKKS
jgi:hypothetical protein